MTCKDLFQNQSTNVMFFGGLLLLLWLSFLAKCFVFYSIIVKTSLIKMHLHVITVIAEPNVSHRSNFQGFVAAYVRSDHRGPKLGSTF